MKLKIIFIFITKRRTKGKLARIERRIYIIKKKTLSERNTYRCKKLILLAVLRFYLLS